MVKTQKEQNEEFIESINDLEQKVEGLEDYDLDMISTNESQIDDLVQTQNNHESMIDDNIDKIRDIERKVEDFEEPTDYEEDIDNLKDEVRKLQEQITDLKAQLGSNNVEVKLMEVIKLLTK